MPTESLAVGPILSINQNQIYALPPFRVLLFTDAAAPTLQTSETVAFTANVAVVLTNGQAELAGAFFRCTSAGPINISLKRMVG